MILISKTYEVITEESAEQGEAEERGFEFEDVEYSFRELVELMRECGEASSKPSSGSIYEWLTCYGDMDMHDGSYTNYSLHYSRNNPDKNSKYWRLAMIAAGFAKR